MSDVIISTRFRLRRDTAENWATNNPTPLDGEPCLETDTGFRKTGDGGTAWNLLPYDDANRVPFDSNSSNGLSAGTVQEAIEELADEKIDDAPINGNEYVRKDGAWALSSGGGGGGPTVVPKTSDEVRSSTTTFTDDSELFIDCVAGETYVVRMHGVFNIANATMDFKYSPAFSATFTERYTIRRAIFPGAVGSDNEFISVTNSIINSSQPIAGASAGMGAVLTECCFTPAADGRFSLQWAQNTSNAGDVTMLAGSYLEYVVL